MDMRPAKIVAIVIGAFLVLIGVVLLAPGGFLLWAYGTQRDSSGYFETSNRVVSTSTYALTTPDVNVDIGGNWVPQSATAAIRMRAASTGATPLFVGIGPSDLVAQYLADVGHEEITNFGWFSSSVNYRRVPGGAPPSTPGQETFWVAKQEGTGVRTLEWQVKGGNWTAVIMNADGSAPVTASISLGARFGFVLPIGVGLLAGGIVLLAVGVVLIVLGARRPRNRPMQTTPVGAGGTWPQPYKSYQPPSGTGQEPPVAAPRTQSQPPPSTPQPSEQTGSWPETPPAAPPAPPP
jgi:hypothetical protein